MERALAIAFGLVMAASAALEADGPGLIAAGAAVLAVLLSAGVASMAAVAVVAAAVAMGLSDTVPALAAIGGVTATCYLVLRHAGPPALTRVSVVAVLGAAAVGLVATAVPIELPWAPLLAPLAVLGAFGIAVRGLGVRSR